MLFFNDYMYTCTLPLPGYQILGIARTGYVKGACSINSLIPQLFFKLLEILVPEVELYSEGSMCEVVTGMHKI